MKKDDQEANTTEQVTDAYFAMLPSSNVCDHSSLTCLAGHLHGAVILAFRFNGVYLDGTTLLSPFHSPSTYRNVKPTEKSTQSYMSMPKRVYMLCR